MSNGNSFSEGNSYSEKANLEPWWFRIMRPIQDHATA